MDTRGRNNLLSEQADLIVKPVVDPRTGAELRAGGNTFTMYELVLIANAVQDALAEADVVGCVVTHGTFRAARGWVS